MANIMLCDACNLHCEYCFRPKDGHTSGYIADDLFFHYVNLINASSYDESIGLIGGEPLLHPRFSHLLKYAAEHTRESVVLYTNGLLLDRHPDLLSTKSLRILVNLNSPEFLGSRKYRTTVENVRNIIACGFPVNDIALGINLSQLNSERSYVVSACESTGIKQVRISLCVPEAPDERNVFEDVAAGFAGVNKLISELITIGVSPYFDCFKPPTCCLDKQEIDSIRAYADQFGIQLNYLGTESYCEPIVDLLQDGTAVRCFGLKKLTRMPVGGFSSIEEIRQYYKTIVDDAMFHITASKSCERCFERVTRRCSGGCLAYRADSLIRFGETALEGNSR